MVKRITLHLARNRDYPEGSATHGDELVAPIDGSGHLDGASWKADEAACRVRRFSSRTLQVADVHAL